MRAPAALDSADVRILGSLQEDASRSIAEVAVLVGLSQNACWRRIKRLEEDGVVRRRVALLDPESVGAGTVVFAMVRAAEHSEEWLNGFAAAVRRIPEVVEFYRMSGEMDYLLKLRVGDIAHYDRVYRRLINAVKLSDISSSFAMEELKNTTALPLEVQSGR